LSLMSFPKCNTWTTKMYIYLFCDLECCNVINTCDKKKHINWWFEYWEDVCDARIYVRTDSVMTPGVVVCGVLLASDEPLGMKELPVSPVSDLVWKKETQNKKMSMASIAMFAASVACSHDKNP
jgi:hypothetical protein